MPVISPIPAPVPVKAAPLVVGATALPETLFRRLTTGALTTPLKAVPSKLAADRLSVSVSGVSRTSPVFSTTTVKVTSKVPSVCSAPIELAALVTPISALIAPGGVTGVGVPGPPGLSAGTSPVPPPVPSVPVSESSVTGVPLGGVPPAVAVLSSAAGAPGLFGSIFTLNTT